MATIVTRTGKGSSLSTAEMDANLTNLNTDIGTRAVASVMTTALATKANSSDMTTALATKANSSDMTTALATKANLSTNVFDGMQYATTNNQINYQSAAIQSQSVTGDVHIGFHAMGNTACSIKHIRNNQGLYIVGTDGLSLAPLYAATPAGNSNDTTLATTAYVKGQGYATTSSVNTALNLKANSSDMTTALATKANAAMFDTAGLAEVGRYLDFHGTSSANDFDVRFDCGPSIGNGAGNAVLICGSFTVTGALWSNTVTATGNITALGNITAFSDENLKTNWRNLPENFINKLANIKSGIYDRTDVDMTQVGVSAQDLQKLLPNAVDCSENNLLSVSYGNAALVACIEMAKELVNLRKKIEEMEAK